MEPALIVVGGGDPDSVRRVASLYSGLGVEPCLVALRTAELIKYACNAFHAAKITFANEIGALAGSLGVAPEEVLETLCRDDKLNISAAYLKPGFMFELLPAQGSPRLEVSRRSNSIWAPMLESILASNDEHLRRAIESVLDLGNVRIGVVGLAFKENTDDLRESPVVTLLEHLIGKGRDIRVYDPHIPDGAYLRLESRLHPYRNSSHRQTADRRIWGPVFVGSTPGNHTKALAGFSRDDPRQPAPRPRCRPRIEMSSDRTFGLTFAGLFALVGAWPLMHKHPFRPWALRFLLPKPALFYSFLS